MAYSCSVPAQFLKLLLGLDKLVEYLANLKMNSFNNYPIVLGTITTKS